MNELAASLTGGAAGASGPAPWVLALGAVAAVVVGVLLVRGLLKLLRCLSVLLLLGGVLLGAAALVVWDQYRVYRAEQCFVRMQEPGPFTLRDPSGYHLEVEPGGAAFCRCHGERAALEQYLDRKYESWLSGPLTRLRWRFLPAPPLRLDRAAEGEAAVPGLFPAPP